MCDRQLLVDCQWCVTAEGADCYCILYILTVTVYKTLYPTTVHSQTLRNLYTCVQMLLLLNCLFSHSNKILRAWKRPMVALPTVLSYEWKSM